LGNHGIDFGSHRDIKILKIGDTTIIAVKLPVSKTTGIKIGGEYGLSTTTIGGKLGVKRSEDSEWHIFVDTKSYGLMPLENWKEAITQKLSDETGTQVMTSQIVINLSIPLAGPPVVATLEYQRDAVLQIFEHYKQSTGKKELTTIQLDRMLKTPDLRDGINPIFEPLSLSVVGELLSEMQNQGKINITQNGIITLNY